MISAMYKAAADTRWIMGDTPVRLDANERACGSVSKAAAISWCYPVDRRLDQLVKVANEAGAGTRRNELAAALVLAADPEPQALVRAVMSLRTALVRDVVLDVPQAAAVVDMPRYGPGRRRSAN